MEGNKSPTILAHGRTLACSADGDRIELRSPSGELELTIELGPDGPRLRVRAVNLELEAAKAIRMKCETFALEADRDASIRAPHGAIALVANDDVDVKGERILLNADAEPLPRVWKEFEARVSKRGHGT